MRSLIFATLLLFSGAAGAVETTLATGPAAYQQPLPGLSREALAIFREGSGIFRQAWVVGSSADTPRFTGLGPVFNRRSCIACHVGNGRGDTSQGPEDAMRATLIRLSVPGTDAHGGPKPEPTYGDQFQSEAVVGVSGEGQMALRWREHTVPMKDGSSVVLRAPEVVQRELGFGPMVHDTMFSVRTAPAIFGLGLLAAVPEDELRALAARPKTDGVKGHLNQVWDAEHGSMAVGRFGLKANQPSIRQQVAGALNGDMGITSTIFPHQNCTDAETACVKAPAGRQPEISDADLKTLVSYIEAVAPPPRRTADEGAMTGEKIFTATGCAACHMPDLKTTDAGHPVVHAYTDLLVHDMGEGLADGRADYAASGREWRTAPLWGIGLTPVVFEGATYLHDGRARTLTEAVLWHGGEAEHARGGFVALSAADRARLLAFLGGL